MKAGDFLRFIDKKVRITFNKQTEGDFKGKTQDFIFSGILYSGNSIQVFDENANGYWDFPIDNIESIKSLKKLDKNDNNFEVDNLKISFFNSIERAHYIFEITKEMVIKYESLIPVPTKYKDFIAEVLENGNLGNFIRITVENNYGKYHIFLDGDVPDEFKNVFIFKKEDSEMYIDIKKLQKYAKKLFKDIYGFNLI